MSSLPTPDDTPDERSLLLPGTTETKKHHNVAGLSAWRFRIICFSIWGCSLLGAFDSTVVATLLSDIGSEFNASNQAAWLGTAYLLSACCFTPIYGRLSDLIGRRNAHLTGLAFFTIGTILCALGPNMYFLIAARCIAGIGGGGIQSVGAILMTDLVDLRHRGLFQGYANICHGVGGALGGPGGGWIGDMFGWRVAFYCQIPVLAVFGILIFTQVQVPQPEIPVPSRPVSGTATPIKDSSTSTKAKWHSKLSRIDYAGSLTLVIAVGTLLVSISLKTSTQKSNGDEYAWSDPTVWGLLIVALIFTIAFILVEGYYSPEPILPLGLLTRRTPLAAAISSFTMVTNQYAILYNIPLYFSAVRLQSSSSAGAHLLPFSISIGVGSLTVGWIMRHNGKYWWLNVMCGSFIAISSGIFCFWNVNSPEWITWIAQAPNGFGYGGVLTSTLVALLTHVQVAGKGETAVATSMSYLFRAVGQVTGVAFGAAIIQAILSVDLPRLITGPDAEDVIYLVRHSTSSIGNLPPAQRHGAIKAYEHALHVVFLFAFVLSILNVLALMLVKEEEMPSRDALEARNGVGQEQEQGEEERA
ncbi:putative multidrug resistance protein fnx1 [Naematelia encephala]|uniref:Putative multidrug resistance protein fnx1 n=1 Tax=Naematelia encephala TaxID=71784 RepID=A0A1Y2AY89_9TREE|nr:putative multidrug resistance protein fnx1 [Naematelia encephala]